MVQRTNDRPWQPERARTCIRGRLLIKLSEDVAPDNIPHYLDTDDTPAPLSLDRGRIDALIKRFSPTMRVTQAFQAASGRRKEKRWDGLERQVGLSRIYRLELDQDVSLLNLLDSLRAMEKVEYATPQYLCTTPFAVPASEQAKDKLYAYRMIGHDEALAYEGGDSSLIVGIVDSGVAMTHQEFHGRLRPGVDTVDINPEDVSRGVQLLGDIIQPDRLPIDEMGHGTACASIIGALGKQVPKGLAGSAKILPARALASAKIAERSKLTAVGAIGDIDQGFKALVDLGAKVINLSFGTPQSALREDDVKPHTDVVEYALMRGCILVAASGNDGGFTDYYPAAHPGVIAVGSVNENKEPSSFSSRGEHVALCAPGEHIPAAGIDGYGVNTGTSFAAPFVAGACALLVARATRYGVPIDVARIRRLLTQHAQAFAKDSDITGCGSGVLDVPASLRALERELAYQPNSQEFSDSVANLKMAAGDHI